MSLKPAMRVLISGAAGQIGYSLIPLVAGGELFGKDVPVYLNLLDIEPAKTVLEGVVMEIEDGAYPLVRGVVATTSYDEAFVDVDVALLTGGFPRKKGMERKELLEKNKTIFVATGKALEKYAKKTVKVVVIANPANTNCLVCATNAPSIPKENFTALTRLDMNRAKSLLAKKLGTTSESVTNVTIWGNHSSTQVPDLFSASVKAESKEIDVVAGVGEDWATGEFMKTVQVRGAAVIEKRGLSSAMSAANAIKDHVRDWILGTKPGEYVSMAIWSDGSYGIEKGIYYSFPVTCSAGTYKVVTGLKLHPKITEALKASEKELLEEKSEALGA